MSTTTNSVAVSGGGLAISKQIVRTTDGVDARDATVVKGQAGTLTTRASNTAGTLTMASGTHGIITGQKIDVSWTIGGVSGIAYNATVGTVAGTSVPFTLASGDILPAAASAVVAATPLTISMTIDGDLLAIIAVCFELPSPTDQAPCKVLFQDVTPANVAAITFLGNQPQVWDIAGGSANPFTGNVIVTLKASNGSVLNDATLKIISAADNTP